MNDARRKEITGVIEALKIQHKELKRQDRLELKYIKSLLPSLKSTKKKAEKREFQLEEGVLCLGDCIKLLTKVIK